MIGNCKISTLYQWIPQDQDIDMFVIAFQEMKQKKEKKQSDVHMSDLEEQSALMTSNANTNTTMGNTSLSGVENSGMQDPGYDSEPDITGSHISQQEQFEHLLLNHLGGNYTTVGNHKMWMIRLFIFAKKKYDERISNVTAHHRAAGVGGVGRNKGAVVISLDFDGVSLCFVSAHLTAHQHKTDERNKMYKTICKHIKFSKFVVVVENKTKVTLRLMHFAVLILVLVLSLECEVL